MSFYRKSWCICTTNTLHLSDRRAYTKEEKVLEKIGIISETKSKQKE